MCTLTDSYVAALLTFKSNDFSVCKCECGRVAWFGGAFGKPKCAEIVCFWLFGFRFVALSLCFVALTLMPGPSSAPACTLCCHDFFLNESVKQSVTFRYDILCPLCLVTYVMLPLPLPNVRSIYHVLALAFVCYLLTFRIYSAWAGRILCVCI